MESLVRHENAVWMLLTIVGALLMVGAVWLGANGYLVCTLLGLLCILVLGLRDVVSNSASVRRVSDELSRAANELGYAYQDSGTFNVLGWPSSFQLTKRAHLMVGSLDSLVNPDSAIGRFAALAVPKARHIMTHVEDGVTVALFDYEVSENDVTYWQAVAAVASPHLRCPYFRLVTATAWNSWVSWLGRGHDLIGQHRADCQQALPADGLSDIEYTLRSDASLEVGDGFLLLYRDKRPLQKCDVRGLRDEVLQMYSVVCDRLNLAEPRRDPAIFD